MFKLGYFLLISFQIKNQFRDESIHNYKYKQQSDYLRFKNYLIIF
jgi:hypothetical protein